MTTTATVNSSPITATVANGAVSAAVTSSSVSASAAGGVGPAGPAGAAGAAGSQGIPGVAGAAGVQGPAGPAGAKGDQGDVGPQGPAGVAGATGAQGIQGPAGSAASATTDASLLVAGTLDAARLPASAVLTSDSRLSNSRTPTGAAGGDLTGTYPNPTIAPGAVITADIADSAVTDAKIASVAATKVTGTLDDARLSGNVTLNANLRWAMQANTSSIDWLPRGHGTISNAGITSGQLVLAFFTAPYNMTATTLTFCTGGTATASLTLCRFALFTVSETITDSVTATSPVITMVARTANDTTIGNVTNTLYSRAFSTAGGYPASYNLVAGTRYAAGILVVGTTTGNWQAGTLNAGNMMRLPPMAAGVISGQTDLPTAATTVTTGSFMIFGRIS